MENSFLFFLSFLDNLLSELSSSDWFDSNDDPYGYEVKPNAANWLYEPDDDRKFVCNCGRTYKSKGSLTDHKRWECGKDPTFACQFCEYRAKRKKHLRRHVVCVHKKEFNEQDYM